MLSNPMILQPGSEIELICESKVKIEVLNLVNGYCCNYHTSGKIVPCSFVSVAAPIAFSAGINPMRISRTDSLNEKFAKRRRDLPNELKTEVLKANLIQNRDIFGGAERTFSAPILSHYLALDPDFARLTLQVFLDMLRAPVVIRLYI